MPCPYLKEVVMLYCDAFPIKKMVPLDRLVSTNPCIAHDFKNCPLFRGADEPAEYAPPGEPEERREVPR
jgi:hypothetical protein